MGTKKQTKTLNDVVSEQKSKLPKLLKAMGVDNPEEVMQSDENMIAFAKSVNKNLGIGKKAVGALNSMQNRSPEAEVESMGVDINSVRKKYSTITDFQQALPNFVVAESTADQSCRQWDGALLKLRRGQRIVMTSGHYIQHAGTLKTVIPADVKFCDAYRPYRGENLDGKTLMVWRTGGIGDLMFIRPVLMTLKKKYDVQIIFATRERYHSMVEQWDECVDVLSDMPFDYDETMAKADYHITYEGLIERCNEAETMDVHDLFARHAFVNVTKYNWKMNCACQNTIFDVLPKDYVVMQIGSSSSTRTPFMGTFVDVANYLTSMGHHVVISGSNREARMIDDFISCCEDKHLLINFAQFTGSVVDAVRLVTYSKLVVAPDSSHVHFAGMQSVPCVGIYGPFPWDCRAKHYENFIGIEPDDSDVCDFEGKHCFMHSHLPCKHRTKCWTHLDSQKVIDAIKELIVV